MSFSKHIPNTITTLNAACGALGIGAVLLLHRDDLAFCLMLMGAAFDFCDGLAARALGAYSPMGKELDSMADMVSFGVLPAVILSNVMQEAGCIAASFIPFVITVFSALRLAKFNIDERQGMSFIGMPTPAVALMCGSAAYVVSKDSGSGLAAAICTPWVIPVASLVLSALLVCEIPMFSFKIHKGEKLGAARISFFALSLSGCVLTAALHWSWAASVLFAFIGYILINFAVAACRRF